ncbi:MAG TPA: divalent-cation tolerance protein CutA [Gammaproteobacteria bacterium]
MPNQDPHLLVLCTCPDSVTAERLATLLVERQLAACVNLLPGLTSIYRWQGRVESAEETLLLAKTRGSRYADLEETLVAAHPYELPEVIAVPISRGLPGYLAWIDSETEG